MKHQIIYIVVFFSFFSACSSSPLGRRQLLLFPESKMTEIGVASFSQMKSKMPTLRSGTISKRIECITNNVLIAMGEKPHLWEIQVFKDKNPNAFALPGKRMGIHTGMIDLANNDDQLAAVIGHEIGHVLAKHSNERMSQTTLTNVGLEVGSAVLGRQGKGNQALIMGAMGLTQVGVLLPFSRAHEKEADRLGQKFMAKAGYDPREASELWKLMSKGSKGGGPEFLSTHPSPSSRITDLSNRAGAYMGSYNAVNPKPVCIN